MTGVCGTPRVEFVKALGADKVIDYTKEDFTQNGETYDLIFDILGKSSFSRCKRSLKSKRTLSFCQLQDETTFSNAMDDNKRQPESNLCIVERKA